jgi:hypothetical protein
MEFDFPSKAINFAENKTGLDKNETIRVFYSRKVFYCLYPYLKLTDRRN